MSDSVLSTITNSAGALLAAAGWLVSSWVLVILAAAILLATVLVRRSLLHPGRAASEESSTPLTQRELSKAAS